MVKCERCGMGFGPIQAAVLEFCPRCKARDHVDVRLIVARVNEPARKKGLDGHPESSGQAAI
jgi:predicted Zn-ribbon and HTH transcriptional regulator